MSIILLIFMSDIFFPYMSDEGCFTFMIPNFVPSLKNSYNALVEVCAP